MSRIALWPLALSLAACGPDTARIDPHIVRTQAEAGSVTVSVTSVEPWADVAERLMPNFQLKGDEAYAKTLPLTQQAVTRTLDALNAQAQVGLPTSTRTVTDTTNTDAAGKTTQTRSEEQKESPGQPPAAAADKLVRSLKEMDDGLSDKIEYQKDPVLQYQTATALFQEVQLLNSYLNSAALQSCFTPYLVRLQIGVTPYARRQPYDVYQRVSFFVGDGLAPDEASAKQKNTPTDPCNRVQHHQPRVVPLVVTDNLELSREQQAQQISRQLGLALSGIVSNVALAGQVSRLTESLNALEGNSLNSLTSVTRVNDSTFLTRLGAANDASVKDYGRAMVARNYNVTVVVLVPDPVAKQTRPWLSVLGKTELRNVNTGELLSQDRQQVAIAKLRQLRTIHWLPGWEGKSDQQMYASALPLAYLVSSNSTKAFCEKSTEVFAVEFLVEPKIGLPDCLSVDPTENEKVQTPQNDRERKESNFKNSISTFWNDMSGLAASFELSSAWLELPRVDAPALPPQQSVVLLDDGKEATVARLWGGYGFMKPEVGAWLRVHVKRAPVGARADQKTYDLTPIAVDLPADTRNLELRYPSIASYGIKPEQVAFVELWIGLAKDTRYGPRELGDFAHSGILCRLPVNDDEERTARRLAPATDPVPEVRIGIKGTLEAMTYQGAGSMGSVLPSDDQKPCTARVYRALWSIQVPKPADPKPAANAGAGKA